MTISVQFPKLEVYINFTEFGITYSLYVNEEYEATYHSQSALMYRVGLIHANKINEVIKHDSIKD